MFTVNVLTAFTAMFPGPLGFSVIGRALENKKWLLNVLDIRNFAVDKHHNIDDSPYGGGSGMVMRPDVLAAAIDSIYLKGMRILNTSPRGRVLNFQYAQDIVESQSIIIICSHYEGIDQRVLDFYNIEDVSIGDYVLSGGEIAAMAIIDCCVRLLPGVLKNASSLDCESFTCCTNCACLLEYDHYTRPAVWRGLEVPNVLLSGHHKNIDKWRSSNAKSVTKRRRPDLWQLHLENNKGNDNDQSS